MWPSVLHTHTSFVPGWVSRLEAAQENCIPLRVLLMGITFNKEGPHWLFCFTEKIQIMSKLSTVKLEIIKSSLSSRYYVEACNEWKGSSMRLIPKKRRSGGEALTTL